MLLAPNGQMSVWRKKAAAVFPIRENCLKLPSAEVPLHATEGSSNSSGKKDKKLFYINQ